MRARLLNPADIGSVPEALRPHEHEHEYEYEHEDHAAGASAYLNTMG